MGLMLSVLVLVVGVVEAVAFVERFRYSYLPLLDEERRRLTTSANARSRRSLVGAMVRGTADKIWSRAPTDVAKDYVAKADVPESTDGSGPRTVEAVFAERVDERVEESLSEVPESARPLVKTPVQKTPPLGPELVHVGKPVQEGCVSVDLPQRPPPSRVAIEESCKGGDEEGAVRGVLRVVKSPLTRIPPITSLDFFKEACSRSGETRPKSGKEVSWSEDVEHIERGDRKLPKDVKYPAVSLGEDEAIPPPPSFPPPPVPPGKEDPGEVRVRVDVPSPSNEGEGRASVCRPPDVRAGSTEAHKEAFWLIFSGEYTKAMSKEWHSGHFCCWQCDESLTGQRYVLRDDHPYCVRCYESVFANLCEQCNKTIGIDSKDLSYKDKHWHEACFLCTKCRVSLVDKQFGSKADKIYCGNCYDAQFASRCDGCGEIFRAGTKKMEYKTRQWHEKCFCCCVCKTPIGTKSFIPREQEIYCATCYEEKFATRCVKCNKIITTGGVTYKNEPWHRECFTCTHCNTSLAGQRFTSRDEKPYCADCFGELFAKRCVACSRPITGIGGTRFISFEDRHWHNDCFICASCKTSLVGRGFITDGEDIICPECAKQKLM